MTFWFGFLILMALLVTVAPNMTRRGSAVPMFLGILGMIVLGLGLIRLGQWFARNDASWLAAVIRDALAPIEVASGGTPILSAPDASSRRPPVILGAAAVLAVLGIIELLWAFRSAGLQSTGLGSRSRELAAAYGALTLLLAYGVFTRRLIAWRAFFVFLAVVWLDSAYRIGLASPQGFPRPLLPVFVALSLIVVVVWGLWWYGLRKHFTE
jgi:hypothetical protein